MRNRNVVLLVLLSNLALFVCVIYWLGVTEPDALTVDGKNYDAQADPYIAERVDNLPQAKGTLVARLVLVGDAGDLAEDNLDNLAMLKTWSQEFKEITTTLYLGDNIYSYGFELDKRERSEEILKAQLEAGGDRKILIPGNHDWGYLHGNLVERIIAQQEYVDNWPNAEFHPRNGCPGPEVVRLVGKDVGLDRALTLIVLDTQWFLSPGNRPACDNTAFYEIMVRLEQLLEEYKDDYLIVASHHPVQTTGVHGGFKRGFLQRVFQNLSGYQATLGKPLYEAIMGDYKVALSSGRPLMYVAGHEHSLQLHEGGETAQYLLVSGAGAVKKVNDVTAGPDTLFAHAHAGFSVLDLYDHGGSTRMILRMVESGKGEVFSMVL